MKSIYICTMFFCLLVLSSPADIVYTSELLIPFPPPVGSGEDRTANFIDLNDDSVADFLITTIFLDPMASYITGSGENRVLALNEPLPDGAEICSDGSGGAEWASATLLSADYVYPFNGKRGYLGVEFQINEATHFGWIDVAAGDNGSYAVYGWAYESAPDIAITAGAIPEPSSVILFLFGSVGVWALRKRKFR